MKITETGWFRRRDGGLAYVAAIVDENIADEGHRLIGLVKCNNACSWSLSGMYLVETHGWDLLEYLPDCTGWNWKPEKWRDVRDGDWKTFNQARFQDERGGNFVRGNLAGICCFDGLAPHYFNSRDNLWYRYCEILDKSL